MIEKITKKSFCSYMVNGCIFLGVTTNKSMVANPTEMLENLVIRTNEYLKDNVYPKYFYPTKVTSNIIIRYEKTEKRLDLRTNGKYFTVEKFTDKNGTNFVIVATIQENHFLMVYACKL